MTGTFLTITGDDIATMTGHTSDLISDLTPLLLPIIAVMLGLLIFWAIISALKK
jgi:hypothetical protein